MISLMSKGQKFVPVPSRIDLTMKYNDFLRFCRAIRLAMLSKIGNMITIWLTLLLSHEYRKAYFSLRQGGMKLLKNSKLNCIVNCLIHKIVRK